MQRHRIGARGNATSCPLPWADILAHLQYVEQQEEGQANCTILDLPRSGKELCNIVSILLKTSAFNDFNLMSVLLKTYDVNRSVDIICMPSGGGGIDGESL